MIGGVFGRWPPFLAVFVAALMVTLWVTSPRTQPSPDPSGVEDPSASGPGAVRTTQLAQMRRALSTLAQAPPAPRLLSPARDLSAFQQLSLRYRSVREVQHRLTERLAVAAVRPCGRNGAPTQLVVTFQATFRGRQAVFDQPRFEVSDGAPLSEEFRACLVHSLSSYRFDGPGEPPYPDFEGALHLRLNVGG
jgi:hypothetical protein